MNRLAVSDVNDIISVGRIWGHTAWVPEIDCGNLRVGGNSCFGVQCPGRR